MVPDMFEYEGPLDLTEYYIRKTELRSESADLLRVEVDFKNEWTMMLNAIPVVDYPTEETVGPNSHHISADNSHEYHRSHVHLL